MLIAPVSPLVSSVMNAESAATFQILPFLTDFGVASPLYKHSLGSISPFGQLCYGNLPNLILHSLNNISYGYTFSKLAQVLFTALCTVFFFYISAIIQYVPVSIYL